MTSKVERLILFAQILAEQTPRFFETKGPGAGDKATREFMEKLRKVAKHTFGQDYAEKRVRQGIDSRFDFYFADETTVVEVALSLDKPMSEYEKDIFKCLLAKEKGSKINRLVFISKPGATARQNSPAQRAVADYVRKHSDIEIKIWELGPEQNLLDEMKRPK